MRLWERFLTDKEQQLGKSSVDRWLRSLKVLNFDAANLYLEAQDSFQAQWFGEYIRPRLAEEFKNENEKPIKVHLRIANLPPPLKPKEQKEKENTYQPFLDPVEPQNTEENFIEFEHHKVLYRLLSLFFDSYSPASLPAYNPIYLYGPEGVGKTHLLQAVYRCLKNRGVNVIYLKASTFTENMVQSIKAATMSDFRKFYRNHDVILIDDIHQFSHKSATQEEFFHTFNALHLANKQIILTSCCNPQQLKEVEPRLISRFEWGIVLPLKSPNESQLKKILELKLKLLSFSLDAQTKDFMVKKFIKNPKILYKALSALVLRAHLKLPQGKKIQSKQLNQSAVEQLLADLIAEQEGEKMDENKILSTVSHYFEIKISDILGRSQSREMVLPRQISMYFCRELLKMPYMRIGRLFAKDHSTVMSAIKQIRKNLALADTDSAKAVLAIEKKFPL